MDISLTWDISRARYFWECSLAHWNLIRHFEKHEAWRTVKRKIIAFWGKFIKNQSKHLSKLTLYHLKKRATRRFKRAREPSRIPLLFLRGLDKKNSVLKKFVFKKISTIEIRNSSKLHRDVNKVRKLYHAPYKCNNKLDPKIINLNKMAISKKAYLLSTFFTRHYHKIMKLKCKTRRYLSLLSCNWVCHVTNYVNFKLLRRIQDLLITDHHEVIIRPFMQNHS